MATIEKISSEEAQRRRSELLQVMHLNEEELRERARQYQLSADEMAVLDRLVLQSRLWLVAAGPVVALTGALLVPSSPG